MKHIVGIIVALFFTITVMGQRYEFGVTFGGSNYIGDVGRVSYLSPTNFGFGLVFKNNKSERHSFRASFLYLPISGNDVESYEPFRKLRGYKFKNSVKELSVGIEFNFWEWDYYSERNQSVPYLYTGISGFSYGTLSQKTTPDGDIEFSAFDDVVGVAIPMVVGYKLQLARSIRLALEMGARYTFTDNLDGSNPNRELKDRDDLKFGNLNSNDWYVYSGFILTYTFGRKPCYCTY